LTRDLGTKDFWVLPVIVPGGSYAEYNEIRLRARRAVLEGLGTSGFTPNDGEHIGFVRLEGKTFPGSEIIPFEWCKKDVENMPLPSVEPRAEPRALILWLRDELFQYRPLTRLNELLGSILGKADHPPVRVIGPRTSASLRAMVGEKIDSPLEFLRGVRILCATPTASEQLLLSSPAGSQTLKQAMETKVSGLEFERLTTADNEVTTALIEELRLRDVKIGPKCGQDIKQLDHIALISEWDTFYGRMLPETFIRAVYPPPSSAHDNILVYHYLRGADGKLPAAGDKPQEKQTDRKVWQPVEATEGLDQADYLRRLARQLQEKDRSLRKDGAGGIKAIGILGTDIYDKLLVLKSLREVLPGTLFFTTSLDARLGHPDEWKATHNLIVGSPFGLTLHPDLQGRIPPFRDAYQTATYAATLAAVDDKLSTRYSGFYAAPRVYEIARNGPFDLTEPLHTTAGKRQRQSGHPDNPNFEGWFTPSRSALLIGLMFLTGVVFLWIGSVIGVSFGSLTYVGRSSASRPWLGAPSWMVLILVGLVSWLVVYLVARCFRNGGEPFAWFGGISIWPTECIRFLVFLMGLWYLLKAHHALKENERTIQKDFDLAPPGPPIQRDGRLFSKLWCERLLAALSLRQWCVKCRYKKGEYVEDKVVAQPLWDHYIGAGLPRARILRVAPLAALYLAAGTCLMWLLGFPPVPGRGVWSFSLDTVFLTSAVLSTIWVTFYVADATTLNRRLIDYLIEGETEWPTKAYANLRKRWGPIPETDELPGQDPVPSETAATEQNKAKSSRDASQSPKRPPDTILAQYLDIDLIAKRTEVVGALIYYPFVLISLLIVSRISVFDNWTWPVPLLIVIGLNGGYAAWSAFSLRETAEKARKEALRNLNDLFIAKTAEGSSNDADAKTAEETISMITAEERGAFAAISRHPLVGALLLPSGGAGIWVLTQYLPGLFN
jgi:hypothetical protein